MVQSTPKPSILKSRSASNITKVMLNVENLQINIPDDTINNNTSQIDTSVRSKNEEAVFENIFQQKIIRGDSHVVNGNCVPAKINGEASGFHKQKTGGELTDDEKTKAIELNVSKKNSKNLNGVRFNTECEDVSDEDDAIDREELSNEITDIIKKAAEINSGPDTVRAVRAEKRVTLKEEEPIECIVNGKKELEQEINDIINKAVEINSASETGKTKKKVVLKFNDVDGNVNGNANGNVEGNADLVQEITEIIQKAVEISSATEGIRNITLNGVDHSVNEKDVDSAPESPLWVYPLPTPDNFADNQTLITAIHPSKDENGRIITSSPYRKDIQRDRFTENPIQPIIKKKLHVDFQEYGDHSLPSSNTTDTITSSSIDQDSIINSDIEDGYQGNSDNKSKHSRELILNQDQDIHLKRDQFIEHEFDFLSEHEDKEDSESEEFQQNANRIFEKKVGNGVDGYKTSTKESNPTKSDIIYELSNIINTNRLDTVIKRSEEVDDIDAAKRSSLTNFQIRPYTKSMGETENAPKIQTYEENGHADVTQKSGKRHSLIENRSSPLNGDDNEKPREFTPVKRSSLTNGHGNAMFKSPRHINRSDSFHSTHQMQQSHLQPQYSGGYAETLSLTPRSSSYISLIGTQRYENKVSKPLSPFGNGNGGFNETTRQKSTSELSIADSPSLQSLLVMKSILSNSRKNSLNNLNNESPLKATTNVEAVDQHCVENSVQNHFEKAKPKIIEVKTDEIENVLSGVVDKPLVVDEKVLYGVSDIKSVYEKKNEKPEEPKKWKYQGPPAVSLSTWGERPKSQVVIKSDNDYKFGGIINNKKTLLQNRFSTAAIYDEPSEVNKPKVPLHKRFSSPHPTAEKVDITLEKFAQPEIKAEIKQGKQTNLIGKVQLHPRSVESSQDVVDRGQDKVDGTQEKSNPYARDYGRITPLSTTACQEDLCKLPIVRGVEYKKNINLDDNFIKHDQILQSKSSEEERVVLRSRSNYEVSRIVSDKPFPFATTNGPSSLIYDQPNSTMTLGRVPIPNKFAAQRQTMNIAPQPFGSLQRNSSFTPTSNAAGRFAPVVKGFKQQTFNDHSSGQQSLPAKVRPTTVSASTVKLTTYDQEVRHFPIEKPAFAHLTLRKTGLKEKILDDNEVCDEVGTVKTHSTGPPPAPILPKPTIANRHSVEPKRSSFTSQADTRDQLLDSIRSFSKTGLKKA